MPNAGSERETLKIVERHLADSEEHIQSQRQRMAKLQRDGHARAAETAGSLLQTMIATHAAFEVHRETILRILDKDE